MRHGGDIYRNKIYLDFSVNLNPLGPPEGVLAAVSESLDYAGCYPDLDQEEVRGVTAQALGLDSSYVIAGNGASELLLAAVRAVRPKKALLFEPGFSGYRHALDSVGCEIIHHVLREDKGFAITRDDLAAIGNDIDLIFLCDPANPVGLNIGEDILKEIPGIARRSGAAVILDESFYLLSDGAAGKFRSRQTGWDGEIFPEDATSSGNLAEHRIGFIKDGRDNLIKEYENLTIIRSLTKVLAIPGIRVGYALASPDRIRALIQQLPEWNLSVTSEAALKAGIKVLSGSDYLARTHECIRKERGYLAGVLGKMGFTVYDSQSPFLLFKGPDNLYEEMLKRGILIRDCSDYVGLGKGYYRIAVKDHRQNEMLVRAMYAFGAGATGQKDRKC